MLVVMTSFRRASRPRRAALIAGLLVTAGVFAATAAATGGTPAPSGTIELTDFRFEPNRLDLRVGQSLTVTLRNGGTEAHDINFPSLHMPSLDGVEAILQPGETRQITLRFDQPGEHSFICTLPGHAAAGMTGAVFVRP